MYHDRNASPKLPPDGITELPEEAQPEIPKNLCNMQEALEALHSRLDRLAFKLEPVLTQQDTPEATCSPPPNLNGTRFGATLENQRRLLTEASYRIDSLFNRCKL